MKKLLLAFGLIISSLHAYAQNGYSSVFLRVTDSATFVNSANTTAKHAANYADIWYSVSSGLFWKWSTVTNTYTMISEGGNFWKNAGTTNLTGDVLINGNTRQLSLFSEDQVLLYSTIGDRSYGIYVDGPNEQAGMAAYDVITNDHRTFVRVTPDTLALVAENTLLLDSSRILLSHDQIHFDFSATAPLKIDGDPGTAGYYLQSNGAGAAPTWAAPSGGGPGSWVTLTDGSTVNWDTGSEGLPNAVLTSTQSFTLNQTNVTDGSRGVFKLITNTASAIVLTFDTDFTNLQLGGNGEASSITTYTFPAATAQTYLLSYIVHGTTIYWSGFVPQWTAYTPSVVGMSSPVVNARYLVEGNKCTVVVQITSGTGSTTGFTISAPVTSANTFTQTGTSQIADNGIFDVGIASIQANTAIFDIFRPSGAAWTASGNRRANFIITYEIP